MKTVEQDAAEPAGGEETFTETVHAEENRYAMTSLYDDPEADFWLWEYIFSGYSGLDERSFTIRTDGVDPGAESATLIVKLKGAADTEADPDHHVSVRINGIEIGEGYWNGTDGHELTMTFDPDLLQDKRKEEGALYRGPD